MDRITWLQWSLTVVIGLLAAVSTARAGLLEDFESLTVGQLNGQADWTATSSVRVVRDLSTDNLLMQLAGSNASAYKPLAGLAIADGQIGTLFFRFQVDGNSVDDTLGLSDVAAPTGWYDYESTARIWPDSPVVKAQGRDYNAYQDMTLNGGANGLAPDTWYHLWMVNNNLADTVDYYIQGGDISSQRHVAEGFRFRNGTTDPLSTFMARVGASATASVFVDDIYVSAGQALASPIGDPATGAVTIDTDPGNRTPIGLDLPQLFDFAGQRLQQTHSFMPADRMPERTYDGYWNQTTAGAWTSGFFAGQLWMMYRQTGDSTYLNAAKSRTAALEGQEYNGGDHDVGFRVFNSFGQGYQSLPDGDPDKADYRDRILVAAGTLAGRYQPAYQAIESWGGDQVIIDNMMNLELLFWAADETSNPADAQQWRDIAINHALTTQREHVRPDGSTYHVVQFDPNTGDVVDKRTAQGYSDESTWSRGRRGGYTVSPSRIATPTTQPSSTPPRRLADYWLDHMPATGVVPYDFDDPGEDVPLDSSAAAIASAALLELMEYVDSSDSARYFDAAQTMLEGLSSLDILTNDLDYDSILREGSIARNYHHMGLTYGDYYFIEALRRYEAAVSVPGDYNNDGVVDAADYTVWRDTFGSTTDLTADGNENGQIDAGDYDVWKANYGQSAPAGAGGLFSSTAVPEPASGLLWILTTGLVARRGLRITRRPAPTQCGGFCWSTRVRNKLSQPRRTSFRAGR